MDINIARYIIHGWTAYVHVELYGFSMELAVQKSFVQFWPKPSVNIEETDIVGTRL